MSRWYIVIVRKSFVLASFLLLGLIALLAANYSYPLGMFAISLVEQDILYDVMLDPGHGGIDPGAIGAGDLYEKHYVLDIVLQMAEILKSHGLKVGLTRDADQDVSYLVSEGTRHRRDLLGRYKLMNQSRLGMSVHANATKAPKESGAIVFFMKDQYVDELYAELVFEELEKVQVMNERRAIPRNTLLLLKAKPPVLLVEIGFMTNPQDLVKLDDPRFRTSIAQALSTGILNFIKMRDGEQSDL